MKKEFLSIKIMQHLVLFCITILPVVAQQPIMVKDVYDFNTGDEFHYKAEGVPSVPPNAIRIRIIGKYLSSANDSVFYIREYDNYTSKVVTTPSPHLEYTFNKGKDTIIYTQLNSIAGWIPGTVSTDTCLKIKDSLYTDAQLCNMNIYSFTRVENYCHFEPHIITKCYALGLGLIKEYEYYNQPPFLYHNKHLFYYKKSGIPCGTPDLSALFINANPVISAIDVYPIPANNILYVTSVFEKTELRLYNLLGSLEKSFILESDSNVDISNLPEGPYFLLVRQGIKEYSKKVLIRR